MLDSTKEHQEYIGYAVPPVPEKNHARQTEEKKIKRSTDDLNLGCRKSDFRHRGIKSQSVKVAQLCLTVCNTMDCSTPGFPVHHQLPELARYSVSGSHHSNRTSNGVTIFSTFTEKWPCLPSKATDRESDPASRAQGGVRAGDPGACLPQDLCSCPAPEKQIWSAVFGNPHSMIPLSLRESVGMTKGNWFLLHLVIAIPWLCKTSFPHYRDKETKGQ